MGGILLIMSSTPDMRVAVIMIPVWIGILSVAYFFKRKLESQTAMLDNSKISSLPEA